MKTLLFVSALIASGLSLATRAQTPVTPHDNPAPAKPADQSAVTYQGPKVVKDSKALGRKMVQKSKPADGIRMRVSDLPVKKAN